MVKPFPGLHSRSGRSPEAPGEPWPCGSRLQHPVEPEEARSSHCRRLFFVPFYLDAFTVARPPQSLHFGFTGGGPRFSSPRDV